MGKLLDDLSALLALDYASIGDDLVRSGVGMFTDIPELWNAAQSFMN